MAGEPLTVSQAVAAAKGSVAALGTLVVCGEVSGFRGPNARSGHCYFQVKDDSSAMDAIVWRGVYAGSGVELRDGLVVQLTGGFDVYAGTGRLSFVARRLAVSGEGLLRQQVAELARRLEREGLMDESRKRPVPRFCERVAVVTSASGSVIDDVRRTLARRNPLVRVQVAPCMVQGPGAVASIIRALEVAAKAWPDAILLVRGGGSFEDLMTFNDEALARAVVSSPVPVVTGIGHEPDTSIADMVADRRCSTPTAAAESVAPSFDEVSEQIARRRQRLVAAVLAQTTQEGGLVDALGGRVRRAALSDIARRSAALEAIAARPVLASPLAMLEGRARTLELTGERLDAVLPLALRHRAESLEGLAARLRASAASSLASWRMGAGGLAGRLGVALPHLLEPHRARLFRGAAQLEALSPLRVLERGYAIVRDAEGRVVRDAASIDVGSTVRARLSVGEIEAEVTSTRGVARDNGLQSGGADSPRREDVSRGR